VAQRAKRETDSVVSDATDQAARVLRSARSELHQRADEQTSQLSSTLDELGRQLRQMAEASDDPEAQAPRFAHSAADQLERSARRLDDGSFDGLVEDVKTFARRRPGAFLLGSVAAGFAIGRLAKHTDVKQAAQHAKEELTSDEETTPPRPIPGGEL
jgi:hypothetical protein